MLIVLLTLLLSSLAVWVSAQILPGVRLEGYPTALVVAIILGIVNAFIRPLLLLPTGVSHVRSFACLSYGLPCAY